ncbi:hypothetical protein [Halobellus rarus]|uniref:DUF5658 domain-containing protein n=1 Tax=Halobellus rarus TaxID=1126237 RepID=A0ABD6CLE7_9EURY
MKLPSGLRLEGTPFDGREFSRLWFVATATYGVGDIVTTIALIGFSERVREANPLVRAAVETLGNAGLVGLKLAVFLTFILVSVDAAQREDPIFYYLPPAVLTVMGTFTTVYNVRLLMG